MSQGQPSSPRTSDTPPPRLQINGVDQPYLPEEKVSATEVLVEAVKEAEQLLPSEEWDEEELKDLNEEQLIEYLDRVLLENEQALRECEQLQASLQRVGSALGR